MIRIKKRYIPLISGILTLFIVFSNVLAVNTYTDTDPPLYRGQGQNKDMIIPGESIMLFAQGKDDIALDYAYLSTNETGVWKNYTNLLDWNYSKKITIHHQMVFPEYYYDETLENFPVFIKAKPGYNSEHCPDFSAHAQIDGDDFVFVDSSNTTRYPHEIEYYNGTTGEMAIWVNITELNSEKDTNLYMYYGNPSADNQENITGTWNSNYLMVLHLTGNNWTALKDSTANSWDITHANEFYHPSLNQTLPQYNVDGKCGKGVFFGHTVEWIEWPYCIYPNGSYLHTNRFNLPPNSSYTVSGWIQPWDIYYDHYVWSSENTSTIGLRAPGTRGGPSSTPIHIITETQDEGILDINTKHGYQQSFITVVVDNQSQEIRGYQNGGLMGVNAIGPTKGIQQGINLGTNKEKNQFFYGIIDEFRVSNIARSPGWILTESATMGRRWSHIPYPFFTFGDERNNSGKASTGLYDSPQKLKENTDWQWTNFTWKNNDIPPGRTIGWKITYVDTRGNSKSTDIMSFTIRDHQPDLKAEGSLRWHDVKPGEILTDQFEIRNDGDIESYLNWEITGHPSWGTWTFTPSHGENLTLKQGPIPINVTVIAPKQRNTTFEGEIQIINIENPEDSATIPIILTTSHHQQNSQRHILTLVKQFLEQHPILEKIITLFINKLWGC